MQDHKLWALEVQFLAEHWQPLFINEVTQFFEQRLRALRSPETAFAQTYARFFLNPSAEVMKS